MRPAHRSGVGGKRCPGSANRPPHHRLLFLSVLYRMTKRIAVVMVKRDAKRGLASLCIGGGMGVALAVERP
ncbi:hypothetical protein CJO66_29455 [Burkholderia ubonensis]|nr:hypothetical protein CJO66_29455 [Burkholderia ubonensis]